jgi:hypothetical protein
LLYGIVQNCLLLVGNFYGVVFWVYGVPR